MDMVLFFSKYKCNACKIVNAYIKYKTFIYNFLIGCFTSVKDTFKEKCILEEYHNTRTLNNINKQYHSWKFAQKLFSTFLKYRSKCRFYLLKQTKISNKNNGSNRIRFKIIIKQKILFFGSCLKKC